MVSDKPPDGIVQKQIEPGIALEAVKLSSLQKASLMKGRTSCSYLKPTPDK